MLGYFLRLVLIGVPFYFAYFCVRLFDDVKRSSGLKMLFSPFIVIISIIIFIAVLPFIVYGEIADHMRHHRTE